MDLQAKLKEINAIDYPTNDIGASSLYYAVFEDLHRYNQTAREWFFYDGSRWIIDKEGLSAKNDAKKLWQAMRKYATSLSVDESKQKGFDEMVYRWGSSRYRSSVVTDARDNGFIKADDLDRDDFILNTNNGTLDLKNFNFLSHCASDMLSLKADVDYKPQARACRWDQFVDEIMEGDGQKTRYLQKLSGICLTGYSSIEKMWFLYGSTTRNGKSTFIETIADILGDYAVNIRPETLAIRKNNDSRTASGDIARLAGKRLVVCSEPPKRMPLDIAQIKSMTGRDTITARFLHQSEFEFVPKFKLICNTNYLPLIQDMTVFTSDRIQVISFDRHFDTSEQDLTLKDKLIQEKSGILNWCLQGLRMFYDEGLDSPTSVSLATKKYQQGSDKIQCFFDDMLEACEGNNIACKDLYIKYDVWCQDNGYHTENKGNFLADMRTRKMYCNRGQVDGKQVANIIKGYRFIDE